jgi:uncharacterized protein (TIGR00369 family)
MAEDTTSGGFAGSLGIQVAGTGDGGARLTLEVTEEHLNPAGTLHGGVLATLVDTAMGQAVRTVTGEDDVPATSQLTVTYLRPGTPGRVEVTAAVRTRGEHLTVCEADVEQNGQAVAHAVATLALLHR